MLNTYAKKKNACAYCEESFIMMVSSNCTLGLNICRTASTSLSDSFIVQNGQFDVICPTVINITVNFLVLNTFLNRHFIQNNIAFNIV